MTESILCLVCLCLLAWVIVLKAELSEYKNSDLTGGADTSGGVKSTRSVAKGSRSFTIG